MTAPTLLISVILIDGSFRERFHAVDAFANQTLPADQYEIIWVEHYDRVDPALEERAARYPNLRIITLGREGDYHSAYCRNAGVRASRGELIVYADGDVVPEPTGLQSLWEEHQKTDDLVVFLYRHDEPQSVHRDDWDLAHLQAHAKIGNTTNYGACMSLRKKWIVAINGWEQHPAFGSHINAHGTDMYIRFKNLGLAVKWDPSIRLYHPWHPLTDVGSYAYVVQSAFSGYRAKKLVTVAYDGLDPARTIPVPADLDAEIQPLMRRMVLTRYGLVGRVLGAASDVCRKIVHQLRVNR
jgi:glycosyltransferase involved in cell wall biosynthesis